jgi:transcriptional regulator with XRE-family HTH domain
MSSIADQVVTFNTALMREDTAAKGWLPTDLARRAGVADMTVSRFLRGERQTPRVAKKLATALGKSVRRYLITANEAVAS